MTIKITCLFLLLTISLKAQFTFDWNHPLPTSYPNNIIGLSTDSYNNVYIFREYQPSNLCLHVLLQKFNPDGIQVWSKTLPDTISSYPLTTESFIPHKMLIDKLDNIYTLFGQGSLNASWLQKYNSDGLLLWQRLLSGNFDVLFSDSLNYVVAVGTNDSANAIITKYSANGTLLLDTVSTKAVWPQFYFYQDKVYFLDGDQGISTIDSQGTEEFLFTATNSMNSIFGVGNNEICISEYTPPIFKIKITDLAGNIKKTYNVSSNSYFFEVKYDIDNNILIKYSLQNEMHIDKFDSLKNLLFNSNANIPGNITAWCYSDFFILDSSYYIPYCYNLASGISQSGVLHFQTDGSYSMEGVKSYLNCNNSMRISKGCVGKDREGNETIYSGLINRCTLNKEIQVSKYTLKGKLFSGKIFFDADQNGVFDSTEFGLTNQKIFSSSDSLYYFSTLSGNYSIALNTNTNTVFEYIIDSGNVITTDSTMYHIASASSDSCCYDFGVYGTFASLLNCDLIFSTPIANDTSMVWATIKNIGSLPVIGNVKITLDSITTFVSSDHPYTILGNELNYSSDTILPFQTIIRQVKIKMPNQTHIGENIDISVSFSDSSNAILCDHELGYILTGSFDPNDKLVEPAGNDSVHTTLFGSEFLYTIRFQNTGNASAIRVSLLDTLDRTLDINSLRILSSSHQCIIKMHRGGILEFIFDNIMLPDSGSNQAGSNGYVKFGIRMDNSQPLPYVLNNKAYIYFDFNDPVITNTAFNTVVNSIPFVNNMEYYNTVILYPNPVDEYFSFSFKSEQLKNAELTVHDLLGRELFVKYKLGSTPVDCSSLIPGIYIAELKMEDIRVQFKFIKR